MELEDFNLPFATENAIELSGGSRSRGYRINDWIVRVPLRDDSLIEQKREAEISKLLQKFLSNNLKAKVTNVQFNGKCAYHKEIQGSLLENFYEKKNAYDGMNERERQQLAKDIAELLAAIHQIPISAVQTITQKYAKICRNENKTELPDFDYDIAKVQILDVSGGKINLDVFKTEIPRDGLALCHNDLHSGNMIVKDGKLNGFIDFGEAGINPCINDFFHLYRLDRNLAVAVINEYNKLSDYKIDIRVTDYQFLSNTGYTLEQRKNRLSFKHEVAKILENFSESYQNL